MPPFGKWLVEIGLGGHEGIFTQQDRLDVIHRVTATVVRTSFGQSTRFMGYASDTPSRHAEPMQ